MIHGQLINDPWSIDQVETIFTWRLVAWKVKLCENLAFCILVLSLAFPPNVRFAPAGGQSRPHDAKIKLFLIRPHARPHSHPHGAMHCADHSADELQYGRSAQASAHCMFLCGCIVRERVRAVAIPSLKQLGENNA